MHLHWAGKSSIGIFLVNLQKSSEQPYDGKLSTAHESGCFQLYVSHITVTSTTCSTNVYIYIHIIIFFYTKIIWNTETKSTQIFNYTQVTNEDVKPSGSNYMANNLWLFSRQIQNVAVPKETWKFSERSPITFCRFKV